MSSPTKEDDIDAILREATEEVQEVSEQHTLLMRTYRERANLIMKETEARSIAVDKLLLKLNGGSSR